MNTHQKPSGPAESDRLLFPVNEAAHVLGLGKSRVWELIRDGVLDVTRIGHRTLVRAESLKTLAKRGC